VNRSGFVNSQGERGRLYFLVGLPQAGKSSRANEWVRGDKLPDRGDGFDFFEVFTFDRPRVVLAGDDFRHALHGHEFQIEAEGMVCAVIDCAARALLGRGFDVLIDETSTSEATLLRYYRLDIDARPVFVDTPADECNRRAAANGRPYLLGPIDRMAAQLNHLKANWTDITTRLKAYVAGRQTQDIAV
jgi:adenylylsulfate kinase-like enzyme